MLTLDDRSMNFPEDKNGIDGFSFSCCTEEKIFFSPRRRSSVEKLQKSKNQKKSEITLFFFLYS